MTTIQLAQRAMRHLTAADLTGLPMDEAAHVVDACNAALAEYMTFLPGDQRIRTTSEYLRAPYQQTINIVKGAKSFAYVAGTPYPAGGYATEAAALGMSIKIEGDETLNRLNKPGELLKPFTGDSGDRVATFYGDAVQMSSLMQTAHGPVLWQPGRANARELVDWRSWGMPENIEGIRQVEIGEPQYWAAESRLRTEQVDTPAWFLRVWPLPAMAGTVQFRIETTFTPLALQDLQINRGLPIASDDVPHLVAMLHENLLASPMLKKDTPKQEIINAASRARFAFSAKSGRRHSASPNRYGTPRGY